MSLKVLVAIANHGTKNQPFLERLLAEYRAMPHDVHIVVNSDVPKDLGPDVEVVVGRPSRDPYSLPFAHKSLFAERVDDYDLFIYTEDDTLLPARSLDAFLEVSKLLPDDEVPGFVRYEEAPDGTRYYSSIHTIYHWDVDSVRRIGGEVFAELTNAHSGMFVLERSQLKHAIASGGFLLPPRSGDYGMLETAATDPYVGCGLRRVICLSRIDDFCLHHLADLYLGKLGIEFGLAQRELERLQSLDEPGELRGPLFDTATHVGDPSWQKHYYESPRSDLLALLEPDAREVLSIGCGWGATEAELVGRGVDVTAVPMDAVVGATAQSRGVRVLPPDLDVAAGVLGERRFDAVLLVDVLQHQRDASGFLREQSRWLAPDGELLLCVPNFEHAGILRRRLRGDPAPARPGQLGFERARLHPTTAPRVDRWLREAGLRALRWGSARGTATGRRPGVRTRLLERNVLVAAGRD